MAQTRTRYSYDRPQRLFHWTMALIILAAIGIGIYCAYQPPGTSPRRELLDLHKSLGMTALVLAVLRVAYRLYRGEPAYRRAPDRLSHNAARVAHGALYALMLWMPITGYLYSGAGGYSLPWFGLFTWPRVLPIDKALAEDGYTLHVWGAWTIVSLLALHVLAVAWHWGVKRDEVLSRMLPGSEGAMRADV